MFLLRLTPIVKDKFLIYTAERLETGLAIIISEIECGRCKNSFLFEGRVIFARTDVVRYMDGVAIAFFPPGRVRKKLLTSVM